MILILYYHFIINFFFIEFTYILLLSIAIIARPWAQSMLRRESGYMSSYAWERCILKKRKENREKRKERKEKREKENRKEN